VVDFMLQFYTLLKPMTDFLMQHKENVTVHFSCTSTHTYFVEYKRFWKFLFFHLSGQQEQLCSENLLGCVV
jgi:hypothetical protein